MREGEGEGGVQQKSNLKACFFGEKERKCIEWDLRWPYH